MMKTVTYAEVALIVGPFTKTDRIEVPCRGEEGLKFLKEQFGDSLIVVLFFDVKEIMHHGLKFTSEPHNQERVDILTKDEFEKRLNSEREILAEVVGEALSAISGKTESKRILH